MDPQADLNADGMINTYDAYLLLNSLETSVFTVPARETAHVTVQITLPDAGKEQLDAKYVHGAYIEGYIYVSPITGAEGLSLPSIPSRFWPSMETGRMLPCMIREPMPAASMATKTPTYTGSDRYQFLHLWYGRQWDDPLSDWQSLRSGKGISGRPPCHQRQRHIEPVPDLPHSEMLLPSRPSSPMIGAKCLRCPR